MADYNGWTNYETWVTALWIDNEEGSHLESRRLLKEWLSTHEHKCETWDALKEWTRELYEPDLEASLAADLLGAAFGSVNWREIVEHWTEELDENAA